MLTGRHPFGSGTLPTTIARVLTADLEPDAAIPDGAWRLIERATQKNPDDRFPNTAALLSALEHGGTVGPPTLANKQIASYGESREAAFGREGGHSGTVGTPAP